MTARHDTSHIQHAALGICEEIIARWPKVRAEVSLVTREGEDAYIWLSSTDEEAYDALDDAIALTVDLYNTSGIDVLPIVTTASNS